MDMIDLSNVLTLNKRAMARAFATAFDIDEERVTVFTAPTSGCDVVHVLVPDCAHAMARIVGVSRMLHEFKAGGRGLLFTCNLEEHSTAEKHRILQWSFDSMKGFVP